MMLRCASLSALAVAGALCMSTVHAQTNAASYRAAMDKAEVTYDAAKDRCDKLRGDAEDICEDEAKVVRAKAEHDAVTKFDNSPAKVRKARDRVIHAEYALAKEKCDALSGAEEDRCDDKARAVRDAARKANSAG